MTVPTNTGKLSVVVHGATGRMGAETVRAVAASDDVTLVGATCNTPRGDLLPTPAGEVPLSTDLASMLDATQPQVMVEFTHAEACMEAAPLAANRGIHMVLGASGLNADQLQTLDTMSREHGVGVIVAPNFALGAVVLKKLAEQAAAFFDYVDVVEAHHEMKIDAPIRVFPGHRARRSGCAWQRLPAERDHRASPAGNPRRRRGRSEHPQPAVTGPQRSP